MIPRYELTEDADSDLEEVFRYTIAQWGEKQAEQYADKLHRCFEKISRKETISRPISKKYPKTRVLRCEHHYVFFLHPEGKPPRVFAVLHERMDFLVRLKKRLG